MCSAGECAGDLVCDGTTCVACGLAFAQPASFESGAVSIRVTGVDSAETCNNICARSTPAQTVCAYFDNGLCLTSDQGGLVPEDPGNNDFRAWVPCPGGVALTRMYSCWLIM